ncbi:MAG: response regulator transcription factor [Actinomycetota bacterium]|nr:response regulator transcription factor [Actinomycetota bacterium]
MRLRRVLLLSDRPTDEVIPTLSALGADIKTENPTTDALARLPDVSPDLVVVDAVDDPARAVELLQVLAAAGTPLPVLAVLNRSVLDRFSWAELADEVVFPEVSESELRLRVAMLQRRRGETGEGVLRLGGVAINVETYQITLAGRPLDLTYKEFELLRFLAENPGRVFSRAKLLQEVWGYDFYGGTRTVDVHVRRLRAKLGPEQEQLIETVRGVGYRAAEVRPPT